MYMNISGSMMQKRIEYYIFNKTMYVQLVSSKLNTESNACGTVGKIVFSCWKVPQELQGRQTQLFAIIFFFKSFSTVMPHIVPQFIERRALFEAREDPSKILSWTAWCVQFLSLDTDK
jgi:hypothetical protein